MLNLESRTEILGITVFQDADRPGQYYYLPGPPHITYERGVPQFDLMSYRKGGEAGTEVAGGFLNMTVDLSIGDLKNRIEQRLKEQFGDEVNLAPVPFTTGTVRLIGLGEDSNALMGGVQNETAPDGGPLVSPGPRFIEKVLGAGVPSLDGDNRVIFSLSLTEDGAAFFMNLLSGHADARPLGVIYQLDYVGLLPAYELEITIDFKSVYEYSRSRFTLGTLFFKADIDNIVEELRRREAIKIKEVSRTLELSTPEAVTARQDRIDRLVKDLALGALFQPSLVPGEPKVKGDTITANDPTTAYPASSSMSTVERAVSAGGPAAAVLTGMNEMLNPGAGTQNETTETTQPTQPSSTPQNSTTSGQPSTPESKKTASDVWNALGRPQAAYVLKSIRQEEQRTVTYNLSQVTAQKQTYNPQNNLQFLASPRELRKRVHQIDLNHPFFRRMNLNVNARGVDFAAEGITQMVVQLRYGVRPDGTGPKDTAEVILREPEDSKDLTFFIDKNLTQSYEYKLIADYKSDFGIGVHDIRVEGPWTTTEARSLSVHPRWLGRTMHVEVQLAPNLPPDVSEVHARVRYVNEARNIDDSVLIKLDAEHRSELVHIRLADLNEQFEVATTLFYSDGASEDLPVLHVPDPAAGLANEAVVIAAPKASRIDGDLIMQDPLGELQDVLVDVKVEQDKDLIDSRTFEIAVPGKREVWSVRLPKRDRLAALRYRERRIYRDGGFEEIEWRDAASPNLVVGIPAERVLPVAVSYLGPALSSLNVSAIVLDLQYTDPQGDQRYSQTATLLITDDPASHHQDWRIRLPDRTATTYRWKMTLLFADGSESSTQYTPDSRTLLVVRPRQS